MELQVDTSITYAVSRLKQSLHELEDLEFSGTVDMLHKRYEFIRDLNKSPQQSGWYLLILSIGLGLCFFIWIIRESNNTKQEELSTEKFRFKLAIHSIT